MVTDMKKTSTQSLTAETKPARKLFGLSSDQLAIVNGGSGVIVHGDGTPTPAPSKG
jgi:hypothetical protein